MKIILSIPVYINIIPKGVNYYKNIDIECTFIKRKYNNFKLNKDDLISKLGVFFSDSHNQKININCSTCFTLESGINLEDYPNFIILERTLKSHRDIIIESLL